MVGWVDTTVGGSLEFPFEMVTLGNLLRQPFLNGCLGCGKPSPKFLNRKPRLKKKKVYFSPKYLSLPDSLPERDLYLYLFVSILHDFSYD